MEAQTDQHIGEETKSSTHPSKDTLIFKLLADLSLNKDSNVLEIGINNTEHLDYFIEKGDHIRYFGTYEAGSAIKEAFLANKTDKCIQLTETRNGKFDFRDTFFDGCFTANTIYFWTDPLQYFSEIYRVLKPGAKMKLAFVEKIFGAHLPWTQLDFTFYGVDEVKSFFKQSGFKHISVKELTETVKDKSRLETNRPFIVVSGEK